uniref:Secreted protein n=1 Tax=Parascaris univalens TaxID=6257 RepID=A0A915BL63_PARUN
MRLRPIILIPRCSTWWRAVIARAAAASRSCWTRWSWGSRRTRWAHTTSSRSFDYLTRRSWRSRWSHRARSARWTRRARRTRGTKHCWWCIGSWQSGRSGRSLRSRQARWARWPGRTVEAEIGLRRNCVWWGIATWSSIVSWCSISSGWSRRTWRPNTTTAAFASTEAIHSNGRCVSRAVIRSSSSSTNRHPACCHCTARTSVACSSFRSHFNPSCILHLQAF